MSNVVESDLVRRRYKWWAKWIHLETDWQSDSNPLMPLAVIMLSAQRNYKDTDRAALA